MQEDRERTRTFANEIPQTNDFESNDKLNKGKDDDDYTNYLKEKLKLELKDISWKNWARRFFGFAFTALLMLQNIALGYFIYKGYTDFRTSELHLMLTVIVPATLVETAFIIRIIVKWIFSDTDYFNHTKAQK